MMRCNCVLLGVLGLLVLHGSARSEVVITCHPVSIAGHPPLSLTRCVSEGGDLMLGGDLVLVDSSFPSDINLDPSSGTLVIGADDVDSTSRWFGASGVTLGGPSDTPPFAEQGYRGDERYGTLGRDLILPSRFATTGFDTLRPSYETWRGTLEQLQLEVGTYQTRWGDSPQQRITIRILAAPEPLAGDCDNNWLWDPIDLKCVTEVRDRDLVLAALDSLPGDFDGNGLVDFEDFTVFARNFGLNPASYAQGNVDLMGGVTFDDFVLLASNFGASRSDRATAVPESGGTSVFIWICIFSCTYRGCMRADADVRPDWHRRMRRPAR